MGIVIENICKKFDDFTCLDSINLNIKEGNLTALLGPSGSGKTTLLRIIAGLEQSDCGNIIFFNKNITNQHTKDRGFGFVFQHYALFKHMNVFDNIAFGLKIAPKKTRLSKEKIKEKVKFLLSMVQLEGMANKYPSELSGGQKQRVALARALAIEPKVLLLDEPFGALDVKIRQELRRWLRKLHDEIHITSIFVTHDQEEALEVSDEIVVMNKGKIEQVGTPEEVYEHPVNPFVYSFLGNVNLFSGRMDSNGIVLDNKANNIIFARPHEIKVCLKEENNTTKVKIISHRILGAIVRLNLEILETGDIIEAEISKSHFDLIKQKASYFVYIKFLSLKTYDDKEQQWSNYVI
ncbi:sulfate/molybdate ABC transporter ATP-binding protein [Helicobacter sp. MIT 14-3879]|uniref:sulfate/molybdate ABC transporter ATP-binding protein n=1 Tax=Helicobacter sp. MIT 14-3879 TaxID=2040649 RepID=UPI000E1F0FB7|nr:sulfate ABC transporter ATP-binding protein [Helicobacter sp. MIT 14-3879]RDU65499.1 sulfate ABC transporter ATP-binding protein [Helicobacter sp. MIT 14-3879]